MKFLKINIIAFFLFIGAIGKSAQLVFILDYQMQWRAQRLYHHYYMQLQCYCRRIFDFTYNIIFEYSCLLN